MAWLLVRATEAAQLLASQQRDFPEQHAWLPRSLHWLPISSTLLYGLPFQLSASNSDSPLWAGDTLWEPPLSGSCLFFKLLANGVHKILQTSVGAIHYPPELVNKALLLKTPQTSVMEYGEIELVLIWRFHYHLVACIVLEGVMYIIRGEQCPYILPSCVNSELHYQFTW